MFYEFKEIGSLDMLNYYETNGRRYNIMEWQQRYSEILLKSIVYPPILYGANNIIALRKLHAFIK